MLYISHLALPRSCSEYRLLEPYQLHQILWQAFPGIPKGDTEHRFLYRHDETDAEHTVLVQSVLPPDWSFLHSNTSGANAQVKSFVPSRLQQGALLRFYLRANPVVRRKGYADGKKRHILIGSDRTRIATRLGIDIEELPERDQQLADWLQYKGIEGGFSLVHCLPSENHTYIIARHKQKKQPMTFVGVDFQGQLRIDNVEQFAATLQYGIGRGKGFGFGLLSIARA